MSCRHQPSILGLAATLALGLVRVLLPALILAISLTARPATAWSIPDGAAAPSNDPPQASASLVSHEDPLTHRLSQWPAWSLPAPLRRPGREDLLWPDWFAGEWEVSSADADPLDASGRDGTATPGERLPAQRWRARFAGDGAGHARADRAFNAAQVGKAILGDQLISVRNDPANPNRQLAVLRGDRQLESTVIGRSSVIGRASLIGRTTDIERHGRPPEGAVFLADELSLQVLHGGFDPRVSRVEVLGRWQLQPDGSITGEQWQVSYASPADGLRAAAAQPRHVWLRLSPAPPGSDPAS